MDGDANWKAFYDLCRSYVFGGKLSQKQVDGLGYITSACVQRGLPATQTAYILATVYHETAATMQPIEEYGKGKGKNYGIPDKLTGKTYYGRGYVQLTWMHNYAKASSKLKHNFVQQPEDALNPVYARQILIDGMLEGWFTSHKLGDFVNGVKTDYINARRVVNGTDRASLIAGYAKHFERAVKALSGEKAYA